MASHLNKLLPFRCCYWDQKNPTSDAPEEDPVLKMESSAVNTECTTTPRRALSQESRICQEWRDKTEDVGHFEGTDNDQAASEEKKEDMDHSEHQRIYGDNKQSCSLSKKAWLGDPV